MPDWRIPLFRVSVPPWSVLGPALEKVFYSGYLAEGAEVARFEARLRDLFGTPHVFATSSCTAALGLALRASGVGPGSIVAAPPMTCVATVAPAVTLGAKVAWVDVDPETGLMDPAALKALPVRPDAVMPVDWGGDMAPVSDLRAVIDRRWPETALIEDAAQAFPMRAEGPDFRCFSFQAIKHLTTADGGCVVARTAEGAALGKRLSWFGIDRANFRLPSGEINWDLDIPEVGFKANMNNVAAAVGNCQLDGLRPLLAKAEANALRYIRLLAGMEGVSVPLRPRGSAWWVFTLTCERRDGLMAHLQSRGIQASKMHTRLDAYSGIEAAGRWPLPGTDHFSSRHLCLPCGWWVSDEDVRLVVRAIEAFYAGEGR